MKKLLKAYVTASIPGFFFAGAVQAQDARAVVESLSGTLSVTSTPMISSGKLTGCTLVFEHLQRDDLYLKGNFIKISGSMGIMSGGGDQVGFVMKALANEFDPDTMGSWTVDLARIYLIQSGFETNFDSLVGSYPSDIPGGIFSAFQLDPGLVMLATGLADGSATIAIGPASGQSDIQVKLDLTVEGTDDVGQRTRSYKAQTEFFDCAQRMLGG